MARITLMLTAVVTLTNLTGCSATGREQIRNGGEIPVAEYTPPAGACPVASGPDDIPIGKFEQDASTLLNDCLRYVSERDGKASPDTVDYRGERHNLGIQDGKVVWV